MLTERTRYRVTGAVFLFALAVIFLPMLFDGDGVEPMDLQPIPEASVDAPRIQDPPDLSETIAQRDRLLEEIDDEGYVRETETRIGEPVLREADPSGAPVEAWAVQVASFSQPENAVALRDQLLGDGYESLLSSVKHDDGKRTRVAVGPLINREDAEALKDELAERYGFDALVVSFGY